MTRSQPLPEIASLIAVYLRQATGDQSIAALIRDGEQQDDPQTYFDRPHIDITRIFQGTDTVLYSIYTPDVPGGDWIVEKLIDDPGSRWRQPETDYVVTLITPSLYHVLKHVVTGIQMDNLSGLLQGFEYDLDQLYNPS